MPARPTLPRWPHTFLLAPTHARRSPVLVKGKGMFYVAQLDRPERITLHRLSDLFISIRNRHILEVFSHTAIIAQIPFTDLSTDVYTQVPIIKLS